MSALQVLTFASAIFGAAGSLLIFYGTFAMEPPSAAVWGGDETAAEDARVAERNKLRRLRLQAGLVCLMLAFTLQAVSAFAP